MNHKVSTPILSIVSISLLKPQYSMHLPKHKHLKNKLYSTCCIFLFKNNLFAYNWNDAKSIHL